MTIEDGQLLYDTGFNVHRYMPEILNTPSYQFWSPLCSTQQASASFSRIVHTSSGGRGSRYPGKHWNRVALPGSRQNAQHYDAILGLLQIFAMMLPVQVHIFCSLEHQYSTASVHDDLEVERLLLHTASGYGKHVFSEIISDKSNYIRLLETT